MISKAESYNCSRIYFVCNPRKVENVLRGRESVRVNVKFNRRKASVEIPTIGIVIDDAEAEVIDIKEVEWKDKIWNSEKQSGIHSIFLSGRGSGGFFFCAVDIGEGVKKIGKSL